MTLFYEYDKTNKSDLLRHAKALENHEVGDVYQLELNGKHRQKLLEYYAEKNIQGWTDDDGKKHQGDKGRIGFMVQEIYFDKPRDNKSEADLDESGVELKVSPLVLKPRAGLKVKERLILGMINKNEKLPESFKDSHIYEKCKLIMLVYYIDETSHKKTPFQFPFHKSAYFKIPEVDLAMIEEDYKYIRDCVNENRYGDLHEGDTNYLSPASKNNGRAFSLKPSYMNQIFSEYINIEKIMFDPETDNEIFDDSRQYDSIITDASELKEKTFEKIVQEKFKPFIGMTINEIRQELMETEDYDSWTSKETMDKAEFARTTYAMLGINSPKAEEFVKANIYVKTLRINQDFSMDENISFSAFEFSDLMEEEWETSSAYKEMVDRKFLWSIFKHDGNDYIFYGVKFWSIPQSDISIIRQGWEDIKDIIKNGVIFAKDKKDDGSFVVTKRGKHRILNSFPDSKNTDPKRKEYKLCPSAKPYNNIISIRPHAKLTYYKLDSIGYSDTANPRFNGSMLPNGDIMTKQCFWFNNEYILKQLKDMFEIEK